MRFLTNHTTVLYRNLLKKNHFTISLKCESGPSRTTRELILWTNFHHDYYHHHLSFPCTATESSVTYLKRAIRAHQPQSKSQLSSKSNLIPGTRPQWPVVSLHRQTVIFRLFGQLHLSPPPRLPKLYVQFQQHKWNRKGKEKKRSKTGYILSPPPALEFRFQWWSWFRVISLDLYFWRWWRRSATPQKINK